MISQAALASSLYADQVDPEELAQVVLETLGAAAYESVKEVIYHRHGQSPALHFFYAGDKLSEVKAGLGHSGSDISSIQAKIKTDLLDFSRKIVGRAILFSAYPVTGFLKIGNLFHICPVPHIAPQPQDPWEGDYPLLIEFEVPDSPNFVIRLNRIAARAKKFSLLLNAIAEGSIQSHTNSQRYRWVITDLAGGSYGHLREGYGYPEFQPWQDTFTEPSNLSLIELVSHQDYFQRFGYQLGRSLRLPSSFEQLLNTFLQLSKDLQDKFTRAAYWYSLADNQESSSARFLHLIQCVETLLPDAESGEFCGQCGRHFGKGVAQRFTEFVDDLVPGHPELTKSRKHLYELRSDLSHGWDIFARDFRSGMDPTSSDQMMRTLDAYRLARLALINWLMKQGSQTPR